MRQRFTVNEWIAQNQENYRVNRTLELARTLFPDDSFSPEVIKCGVGIRFGDDHYSDKGDYFSLYVYLKGNGIMVRDKRYILRAENLAKVLEKDERLGKFVLIGWGSD